MYGGSRNVVVYFVLSTALVLTGCGNSSNRVSIEGSVHYKNEPVAKGLIQFIPQGNDGQTPEAATIIDGRYVTKRGLVPGTYRVEITATADAKPSAEAPPGAPKRDTKYSIPEEYNKKSTITPIQVTAEGQREFNFDLK